MTPKRIAIIFDEKQLNALNSMYFLALCIRDGEPRETKIGLDEVKKISDNEMGCIAKKLFHANQTLRRKKNG